MAREPGEAADDLRWRPITTLAFSRVAVTSTILLVTLLAGSGVVGNSPPRGAVDALFLQAFYFLLSLGELAATLRLRRQYRLQLYGQLAADLAVATGLLVTGGGLHSEFFLLFLVPVTGGALLLPTLAAFFLCASAVVALLVDSFSRSLGEPGYDSLLYQTGLYGAALFALTALLRLLAMRLARQEDLARARGQNLRAQLEINRLVIAQMEQGVVVLDAVTQVRANNLAARLLLGLDRDARLTGLRLSTMPALLPLAERFAAWMAQEPAVAAAAADQVVTLQVPLDDGRTAGARTVRVRFARPPSRGSGEYVMFLEDLREIDNRAQQLKLAAMGRLTASIAHEIRNPLAAISHAGQLLAEEVADPGQARLVKILRENTRRLDRLVDDVLRAARREAPLLEEFDLPGFLQDWVAEFERDRPPAAGTLRIRSGGAAAVRFEQGHLRQILFNLADNALRYGSGAPGCVEFRVEAPAAAGQGPRLWVLDDGAGIPDVDRAAIFEPFFTTRSEGTGLGLYLAREFCIANGSTLSYETAPGPAAGGVARRGFVLRFSGPPDMAETDAPEALDTIPADDASVADAISQAISGALAGGSR